MREYLILMSDDLSPAISAILDLVSGYMRRVAKYKHALLLIDWGAFCLFDDEWKSKYLASLQIIGNNVQTIITTPHSFDNIIVGGWNIIKLVD